MRTTPCIAIATTLWGCWAPEVAEPQEEVASSTHSESPQAGTGVDMHGLPTVLEPTSPEDFPEPPFTAWTVADRLSIEPPGSEPITLNRVGVRIQVLQVMNEGQGRMYIECSTCEGSPKPRGFLQLDKGIRAKGAPGSAQDPLARILSQRARWADEKDLPVGANHHDMCSLVDHGFTLSADRLRAHWDHDGGQIVLIYEEDQWMLDTDSTQAPTPGQEGRCRTSGTAR